jgi:NAD(P)-dependent dehydrogenase (short-subunit alcohol dehydrogenase family)
MACDAALVTGGNSGIGFECARQLARAGWHVIIASRNRGLSAEAVRRIAAESGTDTIASMDLDLASPASIRRLAGALPRDVALRAIVLNAGVQVTKGPRLTPDGYELTFAVNHLGHFLLANLLLAPLLANAPARVIVVSSGVHDPRRTTGMPKPDVSDLATLAATGCGRRDGFSGALAYVNSKLCNLWFTYELVRRLEASGLNAGGRRLTANAFDPGLVPGSGLAREYAAPLRFVWDRVLPGLARVLSPMVAGINPADKAGGALARLVLEPGLERVSGKYFPSHTRWQEEASSAASYDLERARALWEASVRMVGLTRADSPLGSAS